MSTEYRVGQEDQYREILSRQPISVLAQGLAEVAELADRTPRRSMVDLLFAVVGGAAGTAVTSAAVWLLPRVNLDTSLPLAAIGISTLALTASGVRTLLIDRQAVYRRQARMLSAALDRRLEEENQSTHAITLGDGIQEGRDVLTIDVLGPPAQTIEFRAQS